MSTNIEGRLIALEIERKRLSERLERALADIAELKQFKRQAPGLSWNGGMSQPRYLAVAHEKINAPSWGTASGNCAIVRLNGSGGTVTWTIVNDPVLTYNATFCDIAKGSFSPAEQDPSGTWWITSVYQGYVAVAYDGVPAATGPPPGGTPGIWVGDVYGYTQSDVAYHQFGTGIGSYTLVNPFTAAIPAGSIATVAPLGDGSAFFVLYWR